MNKNDLIKRMNGLNTIELKALCDCFNINVQIDNGEITGIYSEVYL